MPFNSGVFFPRKHIEVTKFNIGAAHFQQSFIDAVGVADTFTPVKPKAFFDFVGVSDTISTVLSVTGKIAWQLSPRRCAPIYSERRAAMWLQPKIKQDEALKKARQKVSVHRDSEL